MEKPECFEAGKIIKPFGYKGELIVTIKKEFADPIFEKGFIFLEIEEELIPFLITEAEEDSECTFRISLEDIDNSDDAKTLNGSVIWVPKDTIPEVLYDEDSLFDINGFSVIDAHYGELGIARHVIELPGHEVLSIQHQRKEILLPVGGGYIKKIDRKGRKILIEAPEGLIDSYLQ